MGASFWSEPCPDRGPALRHVHADVCAEQHVDPQHFIDQCCFCTVRASEWTAAAPLGPQINSAADRELLGRAVDQVVTPQMLRLRHVVGGLRDPMPTADRPAVTLCKLCAGEHVTFAVYLEISGELSEGRICAGCLARMVHKSRRPVAQLPATVGHPQEYPQ